ncbi:MAG: hypothetical protein KIT22_12465, partial [Verrucomicrobiae bacterium]|nr:hypothetical protein [Verrucomicrobiae bacterium]
MKTDITPPTRPVSRGHEHSPGTEPAEQDGAAGSAEGGPRGRRARTLGLGTALLCGLTLRAAAAVPLPDHLIYGTIAIDGRPVTRADTGTIIEARQTSSGPVIASYRMGAQSALGEFHYALRIPAAGAADATSSQAVLGGTLVITVRSGNRIAHQVSHRVDESGVAFRLDLGAGVDTNGDGVPENWELATFGTSGANLDRDSDGDGASDRAEYFAGTSALDPEDV